MQLFKASLDNVARIISIMVPCLLLFPVITIGEALAHHQWIFISLLTILVLLMLYAVLLRPLHYELDDQLLTIQRQANPIRIPLAEIEGMALVDPKNLGFGLRVFGSGGFLGYFGFFYYKGEGIVRANFTSKQNMVMIKLHNDRKYLISPDEREVFMQQLRKLKGKTTREL